MRHIGSGLSGSNSVRPSPAQAPSLARRAGVVLSFIMVLSTVTVLLTAAPAAARDAPVAQAPGCPGEYGDLPGTDLCEDIDTFTVESTGALGNGGANIEMTTGVPACASQDSATDKFTPNGCYSEVSFVIDPDTCYAADMYYPDDPQLRGCPGLYLGPLPGPQLQSQSCEASFDGIYTNGLDWPDRGPAAMTSCVVSRTGPIYDGLVGPSWMGYEANLRIEYSDRPAGNVPFDIIRNKGFVSVDGQLAERDPSAMFDTVRVAAPDQYAFNDRSAAAYGDPLQSYEWESRSSPQTSSWPVTTIGSRWVRQGGGSRPSRSPVSKTFRLFAPG